MNNLKPIHIRFSIICLLCMCFFPACSEILSPDISGKQITILSPSDSLFTSESSINFWWEKEELIEQYNFRMTYLSNGNLNLVMDTNMVSNSISVPALGDEIYYWQVQGENEGSETPWEVRTLIVDQTAPDKANAIHLNGDTLFSGMTDSLQWQSADYPIGGSSYPVSDSLILYRKNDSLTVGSSIFFEENDARKLVITANSPSPINGSGKYFWRVISIDRAGNRQTSDQFYFIVQ